MKHPARTLHYDDLRDGLEREVVAGNVNKQVNDVLGLTLYCYSKSCVYDRAWSLYSELARGLIVDHLRGRIVATPFPKFFNVSERGDTIPDLPFEIFEKLDGSLIILFCHEGEWRCATKGSFNSEQAQWAQNWLDGFDKSWLVPGTTYLCEAIYPQNRIVVQYDKTAMVLLAAYTDDGEECPYFALTALGKALGWPVAKRFPAAGIADLVAQAKALPPTEEGWVLRFINGHRLKVKGDEYLRLHRAISRLTPLAVWEMMLAGDDLLSFRRDLPEEFWTDFDTMFSLIDREVHKIIADTRAALAAARHGQDLTDKDIGLMLDKFPAHVRSFVFPYRKQGGNLMQGRSRAALFRAVRPTGNHLAGYVPSGSVTRVFEES